MRESLWERHPVLSFLGVVIVLAGLCVGGWFAVVAISGPKGAGDTVIRNNSVQNRTQAQERFRELYAAVARNRENIKIAEAEAAAHPQDRIAGQNLAGAKQICVSSVEEYNAETKKVLSRDWLDPDLPDYINVKEACA